MRGMASNGGRKRRDKDMDRARSASRRRKGGKRTWKKLLWVKQSCTFQHYKPPDRAPHNNLTYI